MIKISALQCNSKGYSKFTINRIIFAFIVLVCSKSQAQNATTAFRLPAEFEEQQAIWLGWEKEDTSIHHTVAKIIQGIQGKVQVKMVVSSYELEENAIQFLSKKGINPDKINFKVIPGARFWIRDNGAVFLTRDNGTLGAVDFEWNNYGYYNWLMTKIPEQEDSIRVLEKRMMTGDYSKLDAKMANSTGTEIIKSKLAIEGGALETNGKGVLIQCEDVTLQRNPDWSKSEIEAEYRRLFNIKKIIWLKHGMADDAKMRKIQGKYVSLGTGGHVDEFVRFVNTNTILISWIDETEKDLHPLNAITYKNMLENLKILQKAKDQDGNPLRITKVPVLSVIEWPVTVAKNVSETEYDKLDIVDFQPLRNPKIGDKLTRVASVSYLNFLITNGAIINASYLNHGTSVEKEEKVKAILKEVFPDREQIWIDALPVNRLGGGIHCITLHEPLPVKKDILKIPTI